MVVRGRLVCLGAVVLRNLGVVPPMLPSVWDYAYNGAELIATAICALRAYRSSGSERAAWAAFALGLLGVAAADVYWTVALADDATPPYPSLADAGYLSIFPASFVGLVLLLRPARTSSRAHCGSTASCARCPARPSAPRSCSASSPAPRARSPPSPRTSPIRSAT